MGDFWGAWLKYTGPCIPSVLKTQALCQLEVMWPLLNSLLRVYSGRMFRAPECYRDTWGNDTFLTCWPFLNLVAPISRQKLSTNLTKMSQDVLIPLKSRMMMMYLLLTKYGILYHMLTGFLWVKKSDEFSFPCTVSISKIHKSTCKWLVQAH